MKSEPVETPRIRRTRLHIIAEILSLTKNGSLKTHIMYRANLSFDQLNEYLFFVHERGLVKKITRSGKTVYKTTPKGINYIKKYMSITSLLGNE